MCVDWLPCRGLLRHTLANRALVYPSQGGRYRAEGCMALGPKKSVVKDPLGGTRQQPSTRVGLYGR